MDGFRFRFDAPIVFHDPTAGALITGDEFHILRHGAPVGDGENIAIGAIDLLVTGFASLRIRRPTPDLAPAFRRGDTDRNRAVELTDAVNILGFLFLGTDEPSCPDAADTNDSGGVDIGDPIHLLNVLFLGTGSIPAPGPTTCGVDPTEDALSCDTYDACE